MSKVMHTIYLVIIASLGATLLWPKGEPSQAVDEDPTIAVFQFLSTDSSNSSIDAASQLTDDLVQYFSDNNDINVVPEHNVNTAFDRNLTIAEIGRRLSATVVLEGAVRESNDRLQVTVQLIDVETEEHLWSQTYDHQLGETDGIVLDVGSAVARQF